MRTLRPIAALMRLGLVLRLLLWVALPAVAQTPIVMNLHSFAGKPDGAYPSASLIQGTDGNFYSTTVNGGTYNQGTVFKITPEGVMTVLYSFTGSVVGGSPDGSGPQAGLVLGTDGNFYGTTQYGGTDAAGTVYKLAPDGAETVLYSFGSYPDGNGPQVGLIQGADGNFYGTTPLGGANSQGTVFKITPAGDETVLYSFTGIPDGATPQAGLIQGTDGNLYGTTVYGGASGAGTVFKITLEGVETVLYSFSGYPSDGGFPQASLLQGVDGNFYGMTIYGGANGVGAIFQVTPAGAETVLHSFSSPSSSYTNAEGFDPFGGLLQGADGSFYGTAAYGGAYSSFGTVFRLSGVYPVPTLSSISPASRDAGGPAFALIVKGAGFQSFSTIDWNGAALDTLFVSTTELVAAVPASLIASPGKATITVVTGAGGGTSKAKMFTILLTALKLTAVNLTKNGDGSYTANLTLKNVGYNTAPNVEITKATLGSTVTTTSLPQSLGNLAAGASANAALNFPASAGSSGQTVSLKVSGSFTGGTFSGSLKLTLP